MHHIDFLFRQSPRQSPRQLPGQLALMLIAGLLLAGCGPAQAQAAQLVAAPTTAAATAAAPLATRPATEAPTKAASSMTPTQMQTRAQPSAPLPSPTPSLTPTPTLIKVPAGRVTVPILLYHHVRDEQAERSGQKMSRYDLPLADFRDQMQALADAGYETVTISELAGVIRSGGLLPEKPVAITFDDGYLDTYQNAFPVLQEHGFRATAYIISQTQEKDKAYGYMQVDELKALIAAGWEIGSHSISHSSLKTTWLGMRNEIEKSRQGLEALLGVPIRSFSYPFGIANPWIMDRVAEYGYDSAVGLDIFVNQTPKRLYYLSRREVQRGTSPAAFQALLTPGREELIWLKAITQTPEPTSAAEPATP